MIIFALSSFASLIIADTNIVPNSIPTIHNHRQLSYTNYLPVKIYDASDPCVLFQLSILTTEPMLPVEA